MNEWINVFRQYGLQELLPTAKIRKLPGYPHVFMVTLSKCFLVVKKVTQNENLSIDELFHNINNDNVLLPLLTTQGHYCATVDDSLYLLYDRISEVEEYPSYEWWGNCLSAVHNTKVKTKGHARSWTNDVYEAAHLLNEAKKIMENDIFCRLLDLLNFGLNFSVDKAKQLVICHGDPSQWNVLMDSKGYKLIDMENCFFAPREYDVQHLLWNYTAAFEKYTQWESFCKELIMSYENDTKIKLDLSLLIRILCFDFVKSISWLYFVSNDYTREDQNRQFEELKTFCEIIRKDWLSQIVDFFSLTMKMGRDYNG